MLVPFVAVVPGGQGRTRQHTLLLVSNISILQRTKMPSMAGLHSPTAPGGECHVSGAVIGRLDMERAVSIRSQPRLTCLRWIAIGSWDISRGGLGLQRCLTARLSLWPVLKELIQVHSPRVLGSGLNVSPLLQQQQHGSRMNEHSPPICLNLSACSDAISAMLTQGYRAVGSRERSWMLPHSRTTRAAAEFLKGGTT